MSPTAPENPTSVVNATTASPSLSAPVAPPVSRPLISDAVRHPAWLWLTHVLPGVLLLLSAEHTYSIIAGELQASERRDSAIEAAILTVITLIAALIAVGLQKRKLAISNPIAVALWAMSCVCMAVGLTFIAYTIPSQLPEWIVSRDELLYRFFCLAMPGAFYALLLLFSYPSHRSAGRSLGIALALVVLTPVALYTLGWVAAEIMWVFQPRGSFLSEDVWLCLLWSTIFVGGSLVSGGVIRTTLLSYLFVRRMAPHWQQVFMFFVAVAGPIGGLWLNWGIPFPTDFQAPAVYFLALINGMFLMLPVVRSIFWHRAIWLAQCVLFPFSAYFFIVFLPWLPLSPLAMIVCGAGALMLAPLVLGLVHGYRIVDGYREEVRDGKPWKPAALGLLAVSVLPAAIGWNMWQDRQTLNQALDYIYSPDYRKDVTFPGDLDRLDTTLQHLRDMKHGVWLPFLSPIYNEVVFDNLVLPDEKINYLQQAFFGTSAGKEVSALLRSNSGMQPWHVTTTSPPTSVVLKDVLMTAKPQGAVTTSRLTLVMENPTTTQSEFVTTIEVPEGVYVSDFALYVGKDLVPGRVIEKKTALWVYEKIRDYQRRDPGLLIYKNRTELELHVFPFASGEIRRVEIELIHPNAAPTSVQIGERTVELNPGTPAQTATITSCMTPSGSIAVAEGTGINSFAIQRRPYLHILIDCSKDTAYSVDTLRESIRQALQSFPDATLAKVSAVNFEIRDIISDPVPVGQLDSAAIQKALLKSRGGFLEDRALKRGFLQATDLMQKGPSEALLRPQFVIISPETAPGLREGNLDSFLRLVPDARVIYSQRPGASFHWQDFITHEDLAAPESSRVVLWRWDNHYAVSAAGARAVATFPGNLNSSTAPLFYQAAMDQFAPSSTTYSVADNSRFADGVRTWVAQDTAYTNPSTIQNGAAALLGLSKQTRILVPDASYIVVETSSQWRLMEEKEKAKLKSKQVFELEEPSSVPEPTTWILLAMGAIALLFQKRNRFRLASGPKVIGK